MFQTVRRKHLIDFGTFTVLIYNFRQWYIVSIVYNFPIIRRLISLKAIFKILENFLDFIISFIIFSYYLRMITHNEITL
jgi:hypothetical protein